MENSSDYSGIEQRYLWSLDVNDNSLFIEMNISDQIVWFPQMVIGESFFCESTRYFANKLKK